MNGMYRVESDNSVDADEPIMKHMTEGGITILKQLERRKQTPVCTVKTLYNVTRYNRIFNIRHKFAGNGSVSIKIPTL